MRGVKTTIWKKYSVAYSGTVNPHSVTYSANSSFAVSISYCDGFNFPLSGNPSLTATKTLNVSYNDYTKADELSGKIVTDTNLQNFQMFYATKDAATRGGGSRLGYYSVIKKGISVTAATARSLAIAGDYIEDVESEDPNAYPDNGPLGLYFYIKQ